MKHGRDHRPLRLWRLLTRLGRQELSILLRVLLVVSALWAFATLANAMVAGETRAFDRAVLLVMRAPGAPAEPWGPHWLLDVVRDYTALGSVGILTFMTLAVSGFLLLQGKTRVAVMVVITVAGGMLLSTLLKRSFDRPRPDLVPHSVVVHTASFPSGHAMLAAVVYLTLGALLARVQPQRRLKAFILTLAVVLTVLVGSVGSISGCIGLPTCSQGGWRARPGRSWPGVSPCGCNCMATWSEATASPRGQGVGWFCRKGRFLGQNPKIGYQKFNGLQTAKISKKQLCDRTRRTRTTGAIWSVCSSSTTLIFNSSCVLLRCVVCFSLEPLSQES